MQTSYATKLETQCSPGYGTKCKPQYKTAYRYNISSNQVEAAVQDCLQEILHHGPRQ